MRKDFLIKLPKHFSHTLLCLPFLVSHQICIWVIHYLRLLFHIFYPSIQEYGIIRATPISLIMYANAWHILLSLPLIFEAFYAWFHPGQQSCSRDGGCWWILGLEIKETWCWWRMLTRHSTFSHTHHNSLPPLSYTFTFIGTS